MNNEEKTNRNLEDKNLENSADRSNMPDYLVPANHSDKHTDNNIVKPEDKDLGKSFGKGDFGSEEARSDDEKGNKGSAGNMPFSKDE
ncbi:hypothetical protein ABIB40_000790 [Pedobacter sp. UYP30]|uniref:hypothetical protein n=1 Tax=Pedobacter sp. UYP30 TaxID=1756400 RepID=UPI00339B4513